MRVSPLKGQKELLDPLELARVTGSWELSDMGAEIELKSSKRAQSSFNSLASSLAQLP